MGKARPPAKAAARRVAVPAVAPDERGWAAAEELAAAEALAAAGELALAAAEELAAAGELALAAARAKPARRTARATPTAT